MVLVSFNKQFIYTKTRKTAGTSVEVYFEPCCLPSADYEAAHFREETITDHGIVGFRGYDRPADTLWYSHMPAAQVRSFLGEEIWDQYFKFCVIRNPFDKLVSMYFQNLNEQKKRRLRTQEFFSIRRDFQTWIKRGKFRIDRDIYMIDGVPCMDFVIRYEQLSEGVAEVCRRLGIDRDVGELRRFKSETRFVKVHFSDYYDHEAEGLVARAYGYELDRFGYRLKD